MKTILSILLYGSILLGEDWPYLRLIRVSTASQLKSAVQMALPGDRIEVAAGVYDPGNMTITVKATTEQPVVITAADIGKVELAGDTYFGLKQASHVIIQGFLITTASYSAIKMEACDNIRVTRNTFRLTESESSKWIVIGGIWNDPNAISAFNRIDHNLFEEKHQPGNFITIDGSPEPTYQSSKYDRIDHNHLRNTGPRIENGMEAIRVGWSEMSMSNGFTVVEYNLFENCDGDPEIISVKTCADTIRYNTFRRCQGSLCLRHGNGSVVESNFFLGEEKTGTGGVRLYGDDHKIYNNYFTRLTGTKWDAGLTLTNGDYDSGTNLSRHFRINRAEIVHNTLIQNDHPIEIGYTNNGAYTKPPRDVIMAHNLIVSDSTTLINTFTDPVNMIWQTNLAYPGNAGTVGIGVDSASILISDPLMIKTDGFWHPDAKSPAIDAASGDFDYVSDDIEGQKRSLPTDIGADEYSDDPVIRTILSEADVGPFARDIIDAIPEKGIERRNAARSFDAYYTKPVQFHCLGSCRSKSGIGYRDHHL